MRLFLFLSAAFVICTCCSANNDRDQYEKEVTEYLRGHRGTYELPEKGKEEGDDLRYFVQYKPGKEATARSFLKQRSFHTKVLYEFGHMDSFVVTTTKQDLKAMQSNPDIQNIVKDVKRYPQYIEESVRKGGHRHLLEEQVIPYGIEMVKAQDVWPVATGKNVTVCVVDTGIDNGHPDFQPDLKGLDTEYPWSVDPVGHGTHCSGTIGAVDNGVGVVGVAPDADIFTVRVFDDNGGFAWSSGLIAAALECEANGAKVISMSLGGPLPNLMEFFAYRELYNRGILTVAAAGNFGNFLFSFPASYSGVVSVAAVDSEKERASFSQYNFQVDLAAPGVDVLSTFPRSAPCSICEAIDEFEYGTISGTSMATPHVAGVAALLFSAFPMLDASEILDAMQSTAEDLGNSGKDSKYGHGLVDAKAAFEWLNTGSDAWN